MDSFGLSAYEIGRTRRGGRFRRGPVSVVVSLTVEPRENERLRSWKEIAKFLGCDPRTAQRHEHERGLPVHRVPGGRTSTVFALTEELETWLLSRDSVATEAIGPDPMPVRAKMPPPRAIWIPLSILLGGLVLVFVLLPSTISLLPNPVRLISTTSGTTLPPLMTDGVNVYYQQSKAGRFSINLLPLGGGASSRLALELGNPDPGVVAPNGGSMLLRDLQSNKDGDEPLYLQPLPSGRPTRLGSIRAYDSAWMPGGRHIIYSSGRTVYQSLRDGSSVRKLFDVPGRGYWFRWSPDGRTLRFTVYDSTMGAYSIWQASSDDLQPAPVSFGLGDRLQQCCGTWAPDGSRYYFQAQVEGFFHVFAFNEKRPAFPGPATQLTSGPSNYRSPVPLPAGDRLLVLNQIQKAEVTRFDAQSKRWLPLFEGVSAATVAFSPDGKTVAFTRFPDHSLWKCSLPACTNPVVLIPGPSRVTMPRWSPDGT